MYNRIEIGEIAELFLPLSRRPSGKGVCFVRICRANRATLDAVWQYHEAARTRGVILEGQIPNPDERQLSFLTEMIGGAFQAAPAFVTAALQKWMPRMKQSHREEFAQALCAQFDELRRRGKTDSILKNVYTKMMCWLYFKFERLTPFLGEDDPPRILYVTGGITAHELMLLRILSSMGADILLVEPAGDQAYLKQDPASSFSQLMDVEGNALPADFNLKQFRKEMSARQAPAPAAPRVATAQGTGAQRAAIPRPTAPQPARPGSAAVQPLGAQRAAVGRPAASASPQPARPGSAAVQPSGVQRAAVGRPTVPAAPQPARRDPESFFPKPSRSACTNAWMKEVAITEILTPVVARGDDPKLFYNAYLRFKGVQDKLTYLNELYQFHQQFQRTGRNMVIVDGELALPGPEEIEKIRRHPYRTEDELIIDLAGNLPACANVELQRLMQQAFVRTMKWAAQQERNLNKLVISAVYLLCWILRYQAELFHGYKGSEIPCFVLMGGCQNQHDALYLRYLGQLPVDVLILACDLNRICTLEDAHLLESVGANSLPVPKFPRDAAALQMRTFASDAEQELNTLLYSDSGMYRNRQFAKADAITLRTTYDEIFILWEQELRYRPSFSTGDQSVNMPVIFAKISGVEQGRAELYWQKIKTLLDKQTQLYRGFPFCTGGNPYQALAIKAIRNGKLRREEIKAHRQYPFGLLREELQEHIFDKLQLMLDRRIIKGTFVNGTEYTVVATALNLEKNLIRMLQSFDFTKKNPKVVAVCASEQACSLEDAILIAFLNLLGFDIALFVPTGYQTIERHFNEGLPVEHQIGDYLYDLRIPDFNTISAPKGRSWLENILKRGN